MTQRELMRDLFVKHDGAADAIVRDYAKADRAGRVPRSSNRAGMTPEEYARRLLHDGLAKGWIAGDRTIDLSTPVTALPEIGSETGNGLRDHSSPRLLALYADILNELQRRGVVHSTNNPVANYSEKLAALALGLRSMPESTRGYDAVDQEGRKYEVKGRRPTLHNPSRQLSMFRGLERKQFDYLVGVLYSENFRVWRGCLVPHAVVLGRARFTQHANAHIFHLHDEVWSIKGVRDITEDLRAAEGKVA